MEVEGNTPGIARPGKHLVLDCEVCRIRSRRNTGCTAILLRLRVSESHEPSQAGHLSGGASRVTCCLLLKGWVGSSGLGDRRERNKPTSPPARSVSAFREG